jgi:NAD(P)-dependent dehydrogenase (short-subunit alcohol dehydrogenase family)
MTRLGGKRVLVTGAGRRVGAAIARKLGEGGMRVAVHYHGSAMGAQAVCEAIHAAGGQATAFCADLRDRSQVTELVPRVVDAFGGLDMLVASAANFDRVALDDIEQEHWDRALDVNLSAPFLLAHSARNALRQSGGNIVFITCISPSSP